MTRRGSRQASVLVPTGRQRKSYACLRSLARRDVHTVVASEHECIPHFSSRYCGERVRLSSPPSDLIGYRDALLDVAARPDVETIPFQLARINRDLEYDLQVDCTTTPAETVARATLEQLGVPYRA